jgi:hypothetical protein
MRVLSGGLVDTRTWGKRLYGKIDEWLLNLIPRYGFIKSMTESVGGELESTLRPVLVRFDDLAQIGRGATGLIGSPSD